MTRKEPEDATHASPPDGREPDGATSIHRWQALTGRAALDADSRQMIAKAERRRTHRHEGEQHE